MPTDRAETSVMVNVSSYAADVSPAIIPDPCRFSTPSPSSLPMIAVIMYRSCVVIGQQAQIGWVRKQPCSPNDEAKEIKDDESRARGSHSMARRHNPRPSRYSYTMNTSPSHAQAHTPRRPR
jgi:hypothetical protein